MLRFLLVILGACHVHSAASSIHLCDEVNTLDCGVNYIPGERDETICANDGKTYNNFCYYSQARCATPTTHIVTVGRCEVVTNKPVVVTTAAPMVTATTQMTMAPTTTTIPTTTIDHLKEVFCASKDTVKCSTDLDPICGSDKNFYLNQCEFSKATCDDPGMTIKDISFCTS